ncbi:PIN domain nuclease of toxin-antitoxin system [Herbihabitans rhizosphaerae]|uniref:PIN domain nuclease of toxin-antitoxin system n=1 Tax=Herbihabitans rhizosphaerae TaxID=1872711 RepID=A0A4Q7L4Z3_9PSEU|nr:PIN domain-containing protein [Herbihabitans rhizosphaerae]RZS44709.1 PIN domain nuclease of toxin-antitoxin system [Herbihabitans rhizosphaerae]
MTSILDASAALALLRRETGHEVVAERLRDDRVLMSAVNYSETVQKLAQLGSTTAADDASALVALGVTVAAFDTDSAVLTADLWPTTRTAGLSLGDRACLALTASVPDAVALTADRAWLKVDGVAVDVIR